MPASPHIRTQYPFRLAHAGSLLILAGLAWCLPTGAAEDATVDFQRRANQPGVIRAVSFDSAADVSKYVFPDGSFETAGSGWDTTVKASGAGSLRFVVHGRTAAGSAGSWRINASDPPYRVKFGPGDEFYVQWRQRFSRALLETGFQGSGGFKQLIIGEADTYGYPEARSCSEPEIVVQNVNQRGFPQLYHSCGVFRPLEQPFGTMDFKLQNGLPEPFCLYSTQSDRSRCLRYVADEWMTFQVRVKLGPRGSATSSLEGDNVTGFTDSTVQMWAARAGKPSVLIHDWPGLVLRETAGALYGKFWLLPYQTGKDSSQEHPDASTWYDELIISRSRIPDPESTTQ